jgi:hypothetical protein
MLSMRLKSSRLLRAAKRVAAFGVLGLQFALVASAIFEPRPGVRLGVHAEQGGTRHSDQHSEESCVVCAVRALALQAAPAPPTIASTGVVLPPEAREFHATVDPRTVSTRSRAPPTAPIS